MGRSTAPPRTQSSRSLHARVPWQGIMWPAHSTVRTAHADGVFATTTLCVTRAAVTSTSPSEGQGEPESNASRVPPWRIPPQRSRRRPVKPAQPLPVDRLVRSLSSAPRLTQRRTSAVRKRLPRARTRSGRPEASASRALRGRGVFAGAPRACRGALPKRPTAQRRSRRDARQQREEQPPGLRRGVPVAAPTRRPTERPARPGDRPFANASRAAWRVSRAHSWRARAPATMR